LIALKLMPASLRDDADLRARFEREAHAIAALNHPNIVTIHSIEEADDVRFLTLELVEGRSLSETIPKHGFELRRLLDVAIALADAVAAAHDKGITHRDLKPANVMLAGDGRVKVLDFGLAKLKDDYPAIAGLSAMATVPATGEGRILGTVAYMSPEQAEGKPIDQRSDIFSFGVLLYEMATGERPFKGETSLSVLSSILKDTPRSVTDLNRALPRDVWRVIRRCLAKDPEERYQSARDLKIDLSDVKQALQSGELAAAGPVTPPTARRAAIVPVVVASTAIASLAWLASLAPFSRRSAPASLHARFTQVTEGRGLEQFPSLAPDGKWIVYNSNAAGADDIYLQSVTGATPINLTSDSAAGDWQPAFSPDGERIVFRSERDGGGLFVMGRTGEAVKRITAEGFNPAWAPTGEEIVYATESVNYWPWLRGDHSALWAVTLSTGIKRRIEAGEDAVQPSWSPHGYRIAFWRVRGAASQRDIATIPADGGRPVPVTDDAAIDWNPVWSPDGNSLYFSSDRGGTMNLWRVPIDERSGRVLGPPDALSTPAHMAGQIAMATSVRRLAYASIDRSQSIEQIGFDPESETVIGAPVPITTGSRLWDDVSLSPDGGWLALASAQPQEDLYVARADGSGLRQLTNGPVLDRYPRWSPDGKRIVFQSNGSGSWDAWVINADGSGLARLTRDANVTFPNWSPDGSRMVFFSMVPDRRVFMFDPRRPWESQVPERIPAASAMPGWSPVAWSPDGHWLSGCSDTASGVYSTATRTYTKIADQPCAGTWLSDSRRLIMNRPGHRAQIIDRVSKSVRDLEVSAPGYVGIAAVSPDNRRLYILHLTDKSEIWLADLK